MLERQIIIKNKVIEIVWLDQFNIDFDCNKVTPFFQSKPNYRIRFDFDKIRRNMLQEIINDIYGENKEIEMIFTSAYISNGRRVSSKSRIGEIIPIRNWKENIVLDEDINEGAVYANVKRLDRTDVYNYCFAIKRGFREAYISFFSDMFLLYVSSDVIDIILNNECKIKCLKESYVEVYDKYYEGN